MTGPGPAGGVLAAAGDVAGVDAFTGSRERFETMVSFLHAEQTGALEHAELETLLDSQGRQLLRQLLQDHLELRAEREERLPAVLDVQGTAHTSVETGHRRGLHTIFGERRLAAIEASRGSYDDTVEAIARASGQQLGKRQVEGLATRAAVDFDAFYTTRQPPSGASQDILVLSCDGKGVVMRPDALRHATAAAAAHATPKLASRLSRGEKRNRKRMAELGTVYDATPAARSPADILPAIEAQRAHTAPGPAISNKWLTASVVADAAGVVGQIFDDRRDPDHQRTWVALVDGNNHQINRIAAEAHERDVPITIVIDLCRARNYADGPMPQGWKAL